MLRKYCMPLGISAAIVLLFVAPLFYPGVSQYDPHAIGYDWQNNYLSNLFGKKAVNGADNASRPWAVSGMLFLCVSFAAFFVEFSRKIALNGPAGIRKFFGVGAMVLAFLAVTPTPTRW